MVQYRIYDRKTLTFVDGGVVRDYTVDIDYISNNGSTAIITKESQGFRGDIIALLSGVSVIVMGVITAIDNTEKKITFKHMKELFNDTVINVFKFTDLLNIKFDGVDGMKTILEFAYLLTDDTQKLLPLVIKTKGDEPNAIYIEDDDTINLIDFIDFLFDTYNIVLEFDLDFNQNKIICTIVKNVTEGCIIKDNIKLSEPAFDNNELPTYNKCVLYDADWGTITNTYYLCQDNSLTDDPDNPDRILPPVSKYVAFDDVQADLDGYTAEDLAKSELQGNIYNHCVLYKLSKQQTMVKPSQFNIGDKVTIVYKDREYQSIFTGLKFNMKDPYYTCVFGKTRIDFTDRMKIYNDRRYKKRS